jgi:hypothetical protein
MRHLLLRIVKKLYFLFPEKTYLKILFYLKMGKPLDLNNPKTMNEKLQWLKLYNRKPEYTQMVDKVLAKEYVAKLIGEKYVVPTLGVWNHFDEIDFDQLPNQFVLKTNHCGGGDGVVICKDKNTLDKVAVKKKLEKALKIDISRSLVEWPYRNIKRKILAEVYLGDHLTDYKFYCFDGDADVVMNCIERETGHPKFYFFDKEWNLRRLNKRGKEAPEGFSLPKPEGMDEMFDIAARLSEGLPYARVDLYNVNGKIYFSEITFFPASGFDKNRLPEADLYFGEKIKLPQKTK